MPISQLAPEQPDLEDSPGCLGGPGLTGRHTFPPERQSEGDVFPKSRTATQEEAGLREQEAQVRPRSATPSRPGDDAPLESWLPTSQRGQSDRGQSSEVMHVGSGVGGTRGDCSILHPLVTATYSV